MVPTERNTLAEQFVDAVHEAATRRRDADARLVEELGRAETFAEAERIRAHMRRVRHNYEASLMAATVAMQSRNDLRRAGLATLEPTGSRN